MFLFKTLAIVLLIPFMAQAEPDLQYCEGEYALCAAATGVISGEFIRADNGEKYPAATVLCPIFNGKALADLSGGNMTGSCDAPTKETIWSLFAVETEQPQEMLDWEVGETVVQFCGSDTNAAGQMANCFSFLCEKIGKVNGVELASCSCPVGQSENNNTPFVIQAGQGNKNYCANIPVGAPLSWIE
jgi:hypothetical protein